jgi:hypothetical protein
MEVYVCVCVCVCVCVSVRVVCIEVKVHIYHTLALNGTKYWSSGSRQFTSGERNIVPNSEADARVNNI